MQVRRQGDWLIAKVGDEQVMMSREKVHHIGITTVGARIWELMDSPQDIEGICIRLRQEYAIAAEECRAEVDAFLHELAGHGAVIIDTAPTVR